MKKSTLLLSLFILFSFALFAQNPETNDTIVNEADTAVLNDISATSNILAPNEGFSLNSLWRGALGMASLLLLAFLFSSNRRAINWKTVGVGLALQLVIAISVLKVPLIQLIFEQIGKIFVSILEFTRAGSKFLFEGLVVDTGTFGYIFAFQVLPTIIFCSALTSLLFYLGVIQKVV